MSKRIIISVVVGALGLGGWWQMQRARESKPARHDLPDARPRAAQAQPEPQSVTQEAPSQPPLHTLASNPASAHGSSAAAPSVDPPLAELHGLMSSSPERALSLARAQNARTPRAPEAAERAWIAVRALVNLERFEEARAQATLMQTEYPGTSFAQDVKRHLLVHPLGLPERDH